MGRVLALAVLGALALAGCSAGDGGGGGGDEGAGEPAQDAAPSIAAPAWQVGQWWTLASEQAEQPFSHVVADEAGDDWIVDTDSPDIAFFDARYDISFLGPVRKSDLAGSQGDARVKFFDFPLQAQKNWTTTWDGLDINVHVVAVADGRADLEARLANGTLYASYTYDERLGYFREYAFYGPDGESVGFAARVTSDGIDFGGDLVRWTLETRYETQGDMVPAFQGFDLDAGITDVWVDFRIACSTGAFSVHVGSATGMPQERGFSATGPCPQAVQDTFTLPPPAQDDEAWGAVIAQVPTTQATLDVAVIARTQAVFSAGQAP